MTQNDSAPQRSAALLAAGLAALLLAIFASAMLVYQHFTAAALPGCGHGSGCAALSRSPYGRIPPIDLPVSFVGLAWFMAAAAGWAVGRGRGPSTIFLWLVRLGAAASVFFAIVMAAKQTFCLYCALSHAGNLAFWLSAERARAAVRAPAGPLRVPGLQGLTAALVFIAAVSGLFARDRVMADEINRRWARDLAESTEAIIEGSRPGERTRSDVPFSGRWLTGPELAAIRIVIFSDYQCPDCRNIELQARRVLAARSDVSFSAKHFPMSNQCNTHMGKDNPHPNACWAARAAEAAGMLRGNEGFWEMHHLLFDRQGSFTNDELRTMVGELGYDVDEFITVMSSQETLTRVRADIEEAKSLGLHFTPMIFVNAVELKGYMAPEALVKMVDAVAATSPPPLTAHYDQPPTAARKHVEDWAEKQRVGMRGLEDAWSKGNAGGPVHIVVWGDLAHSITRELDATIDALIERRGDVKYTFRQYPINKACNPRAQQTLTEQACLFARAAEAAGALGGSEGYWRMHDWLLEHQSGLTEDAIRSAAAGLGFDGAALVAAMSSPDVDNAIRQDCIDGGGAGVGRFIPAVYVNGKWVPRWRLEGGNVMDEICALAAREAAAAPADTAPP